MMDRRKFIAATVWALVPLIADAQPAGTTHRIGFLSGGSSSVANANTEAFRQGMRELGWSEGKNIVIDFGFADGRYDRLPNLATEMVQLKTDIIVASPAPAAVAARNATATIPIVMVSVGDPVGLGLVASLARPGRNVTGLAYSVGLELFGKQLELLKEIAPKVRRVAILSNPANPANAIAVEETKVAARSLGMELLLLEARSPDGFEGAFAAMAKEPVGALLVVPDPVFNLNQTRLIDLAARSRLPSAFGLRGNVEAGGLLTFGPNLADQYRRAATYVDKILKGAKPADLPVEQPTKFELVINLKTAKALGITIPQSVILRADQVIE